MYKFIICITAAVMLLSACGQEAYEKEEFNAKALLDEAEAAELLGYEAVQSYESGYTKTTVRYDSDPIGKDPIIVELYSPKDKNEDIYNKFETRHSLRDDSEDISDYDAEAFLAYPSVNIYKNGYMAIVTAGSGSDEEQKQLLHKVGSVVSENLNKCAKEG